MTDLRRANRRQGHEDWRLRRASPRGWPLVLRVETFTGCRLRCPPCYKPESADPVRSMAPRLWNRLLEEVFPRVDVVELGWDGEVLHDPALPDRLARWPVDGPGIHLFTSGDGLGTLAPRLAPHLRRLVVSVEVVDPVDYAAARPSASWSSLQRALERVARELPAARRPVLEFRLTLYRGNVAAAPGLVHRLARERPRCITLVPGAPLAAAAAPQVITGREPAVQMALARARRQAAWDGVPLRIELGPDERSAPGRGRALPVTPTGSPRTLWTHGSVDVDGVVAICCPPRLARVPFGGRLGEQSFQEAWCGPGLVSLRAAGGPVLRCPICPRRGGVGATSASSEVGQREPASPRQ